MNTSRAKSKGRYTTGLPSIIATAKRETQDVTSSQAERPVGSRRSEAAPRLEEDYRPAHIDNAHPANVALGDPSTLYHKQAVLLADSLLPYQRPPRRNDARNLAAQLILVGEDSGSSSDRTSSPTAHSLTASSNSSNPRSHIHEDENARGDRLKPSHALIPNTSLDTSKLDNHNDRDRYASPPPSHSMSSPKESLFSSKTTNTVEDSLVPTSSQGNSKRADSSSPIIPRSSSEVPSHHATPAGHFTRSTYRHRNSELQTPPVSSPPPVIAGRKLPGRRFIVPESDSNSLVDEPPDVEYENVEGVELDTQPSAAREKQTGLSLPEIEARDVRRLPTPSDESRDGMQSTASGSRNQDSPYPTIPEDSREDLPDIADDRNEDLVEPPPIALSKEFEERDSKMMRAIQTAKSLISKML